MFDSTFWPFWRLSDVYGVKGSGLGRTHVSSSTEVKIVWSYISTSPYVFMSWDVMSGTLLGK
jgi:hypothetical protein